MDISGINTVLAKGKEFEQLVLSFDPIYDDLLKAIEIVKKFITDNKLIIYGGTAIDMALRLRGDKIYPDNIFPDLDFYSSENAEHAYQLADILYAIGYEDTRAINARHLRTMRNDLADNHFITDISYQPAEVLKIMPYLEYNGMRIVHPTFQRIDIHSALSFPYDNPPNEVFFDRWKKDITRFNKLDQYYPVKTPDQIIKLAPMTIPKKLNKFVLGGLAAYAFIFHEFRKISSVSKDIFGVNLELADDTIIFDAIDNRMEIMHMKIDKIKDLITDPHTFEPFGSLLPMRLEGTTEYGKLIAYSTKNKLLSINQVEMDGVQFRIVNVQYLMKHFLVLHFMNNNSPRLSNTYLALYTSLLSMIRHAEEHLSPEDAKEHILFPSVQTYGHDNIDVAKEVALNRLYSETRGDELYTIPRNYYPARNAVTKLPHPPFNPDDSEFFRERGLEI